MSTQSEYFSHFLRPWLSIPLESDDDDAQFSIYTTDQGAILPVFSSTLQLARFCGEGQNYTELAPSDVLSLALEQGVLIGFDLEDSHAVILTQDDLRELSNLIASQEAIEEIEEFDFIPANWDTYSLQTMAKALPSDSQAWMMMSGSLGAILVVESDVETLSDEAQIELRGALLSWESGDTARLLVLPKNHPRLENMRADLQAHGHFLQASPKQQAKKPPILRI